MKRVAAAIGALFCAWAGMGMLGIVSGWSNTETLFAKFLGACFLIVSFRLVRHVMAPGSGGGDDDLHNDED
jgi:hypothetical protein